MNERERELVELYRRARADDQRGYYERTAARFEAAHQQLLLGSAVVFGLSGAAAALSGIDVPVNLVWAILATVLPAATTAIAAYEGLFGFERVAKLYRDAARNLRHIPPPVVEDSPEAAAAATAYVAAAERIMERERAQWGQLSREPSSPTADAGSH